MPWERLRFGGFAGAMVKSSWFKLGILSSDAPRPIGLEWNFSALFSSPDQLKDSRGWNV